MSKLHSKRVEKMSKLHSKRVKKMSKLHSKRVEKIIQLFSRLPLVLKYQLLEVSDSDSLFDSEKFRVIFTDLLQIYAQNECVFKKYTRNGFSFSEFERLVSSKVGCCLEDDCDFQVVETTLETSEEDVVSMSELIERSGGVVYSA
jgi:hypothetical protein